MNTKDCFEKRFLVRVTPSLERAEKSLEQAAYFIKQAESNLPLENYKLVLFCSYTSMFHSARAILFQDGVKERSHVCVIEYLKSEYPDITSFANTLDSYRRNRHDVVYGLDYLVSEIDAQGSINDAKEFRVKVLELIGS